MKQEKEFSLPKLIMPEKLVLCSEPITLEAPIGYDRYVWSNGFEGRKLTVTQQGRFAVLAYKNGNSHLAAYGFTDIVLTEAGKLQLPSDTNICLKTNFQLAVPTNFTQVRWSDGTTGNNYTVNTTEPYNRTISVWASNENGCYTSDTIC
ncbi:MAG: hypothetical protein ACOVNR_11790, partial [Chitinophagaceae bacterium]